MIDPRIIPCLQLLDRRLVKTKGFEAPRYVGDPVNVVNIFSTLGADEIFLLDIGATRARRGPDLPYLAQLSEESSVPVGYGGGIKTMEDVRAVLAAGAEKAVLGTAAGEEPAFVERAASLAGSQAIVVSIDFGRDASGTYRVLVRNGTQALSTDPVEYACEMERRGAGELLLHSIDLDGSMDGYDLRLTAAVARAVKVPVIACGGAGQRRHLREAIEAGGASAAGAGSIFVFQGRNRSVVVNYLTPIQRRVLFA